MNNDDHDFPPALLAPARRALAAAGVRSLEELSGCAESQIRSLHGMGPKAVSQLRAALHARGLSFAQGGRQPAHDGPEGTPPSMKFRTTVELGGKTATGLEVPDEVVDALASGKRPPVHVTLRGYTYRTTIAAMGGRSLVPLSAEHRSAAGVAAGDQVDVEIALDIAPREVDVPEDLTAALARDQGARQFFDALAFTHRKEWVQWIEEAKRAETRRARIDKAVTSLRAGKRTH